MMRLVLVLLGLVVLPVLGGPRLYVSTESLQPESEVEVIFDEAMVDGSLVGRELAEGFVVVKPALAGVWKWKAVNVVSFQMQGVPQLGGEYSVRLARKMSDVRGGVVESGAIGKLSVEPFQVETASILSRWDDDYSARTARFYVRFNDEVRAQSAAAHLWFENGQGKRVAAETRQAKVADLDHQGQVNPTWRQRGELRAQPQPPAGAAGAPQPLAPEVEVPNGLLVRPAVPLPPGAGWKLVYGAGLPNQDGSAKLTDAGSKSLGDIEPFAVNEVQALVEVDQPRRIAVRFNHKLPKELDAAQLGAALELTPLPVGVKFKSEGHSLVIEGGLDAQADWTLKLQPGLLSGDGLPLAVGSEHKLAFERLEAAIGLPSQDEAQLAVGTRTYQIQTVNMESLRIRVKRVAGTAALRTIQGYRHYTGAGPNEKTIEPTQLLPYEIIDGEQLADIHIVLSNPLDTSATTPLNWDKILPAGVKFATLFIEVEATPKQGIKERRARKAEALVQLTDIGLAWKSNRDEVTVFAFSCQTGEPLEGVSLQGFGEDAAPVTKASTGTDGTAVIRRDPRLRHLTATRAEDNFTATFDQALPSVSMWYFPVQPAYEHALEIERKVMLFTDRDLYRPGETVRIKGIVRRLRGNELLGADPEPARLRLTDGVGREVSNQNVVVGPNGSFDQSVVLPSTSVGTFTFCLEYPGELEAARNQTGNWWASSRIEDNAQFFHTFQVQEFRRNAFEVNQTLAGAPVGARAVHASLSARYYQDQPVANGKLQWQLRVDEVGFYPQRFRDYLFGDHSVDDSGYWAFYYGFSDMYGSPQRGSHSDSGQAQLDADGKLDFSVPLPEGSTPTPRQVRVFSSVTDLNHQTLTTSNNQTVHPASVYAGVGRVDRLIRVGEEVPLRVVAVDPDGNPLTAAVEVKASWSREVNDQTKVRGADGESAVRNDARREALGDEPLVIRPEDGTAGGSLLMFKPQQPGAHRLVLEGKDAEGRVFRTTTSYYVYGSKEFPWAYENEMKIKLVPERSHYKPGETARVLVLSPIEGTALVTVERETVLRKFLVKLQADKPVIEVPLGLDDAPNVYVSVLVIKGAQDNQREFKEPTLRLGFCELGVENQRDRLKVELGSTPTVRPGAPVIVRGRVLTADGKPAAGAEVTVYAEDEGTLAVLGYQNPDPMAYFHAPRLLAVQTGSSLGKFLPESPDARSYYNKGFFVGGGDGELGMSNLAARSNFDPCAFWMPAVITAADGTFEFTSNVPDTLTRYRLIAVAHHKLAAFGQAVGGFVVDKPLMLEPKVPRFANQGDVLRPQVLVRNNSPRTGVWKVALTLGSEAAGPDGQAGATLSEEVALGPGAAAVVSFETHFVALGEAQWKWSAQPVSLVDVAAGAEDFTVLRDAVESRFPVQYPVPVLRDVRLVRVTPGKESDLLAGLAPEVLGGRGEVTVELAPSLLVEGAGAADYLLTYPYGCAEQTTSTMLAWLAVPALRDEIPTLQRYAPEKVRAAVQAGADRLVSMQHVSGGFVYWPGATDVADWVSSYAALGLVLAKEQGANVPEATLTAMKKYLSESLRGLGETPSSEQLEEAARTLWVLALAGAPEPSYHDLLQTRMAALNPRARAYLALAIAAGNGANAKQQAAAVLASKTGFAGRETSWMPYENNRALELLATLASGADPGQCDEMLDKLVNQRGAQGHWATTWANGWTLLAMADYVRRLRPEAGEIAMSLKVDGAARELRLGPGNRSSTVEVPLRAGLRVALASDKTVFARVRVAARPALAPQRPVSVNGMEITRTYERVLPDGRSEQLTEPKLGELVRVSLRITVPRDGVRYLVVDDPLPAIFETVSSEFATQSGDVADAPETDWAVSHLELRSERAVFFLDELPNSGTYTLSYMARCTLPGAAVAPPAKVEVMYDPKKFALSASREFVAAP